MKEIITAIVGVIIIIFVFTAIDSNDSHYTDKGYRLCMHAIDPSNSDDSTQHNATPEFIDACGAKYVGLIINNNNQ